METNTRSGPLAGLKVIEMGHSVAAPYAAHVLSELGAEVTKIERPGAGDPCRGWGPPFAEGQASLFMALNRGKQSRAFDLRSDAAKAELRALILDSDIVIQNLKPGQAEELGFGAEALCAANPRLIHTQGRTISRPDGRPGWAVGIARDVTEERNLADTRRRAEQEYRRALEAQQRRLEASQAAGQVGTWEIDLATGEVTNSIEYQRLHGEVVGMPDRGMEKWLADVHPDDREAMRATWDYREEYAVEYRWVRDHRELSEVYFLQSAKDILTSYEMEVARQVAAGQLQPLVVPSSAELKAMPQPLTPRPIPELYVTMQREWDEYQKLANDPREINRSFNT